MTGYFILIFTNHNLFYLSKTESNKDGHVDGLKIE